MSREQNAIILAAGFSSRFAPLSYEKPKALVEVQGEILIERQIRQLQEAGIQDITLIVGYKKEMFDYLKDRFGVAMIENGEYAVKNNLSSMYAAKEKLKNTYICSADNYFTENVFVEDPKEAYYSAEYAEGRTEEWCISFDEKEQITHVTIGGENAYYMIGHAYFSEAFTLEFLKLLEETYPKEEASAMLWEHMYIRHIENLPMKIKKFEKGIINEFDSLSELKEFDESYKTDTRSWILKSIAEKLKVTEDQIENIKPLNSMGDISGFSFTVENRPYEYLYETQELRSVETSESGTDRKNQKSI